ncbi:MAG TPA: hypothetical protein VL860_02650 [Planctomycetota bacterium]|nr:hypothetical protein [Planctomycetota bacterium]
MRIKSIILLPVLAIAVGLFLVYNANHPAPKYPDKGDRPFRIVPRATVHKLVINVPIYRDYNPDEVMPEIEGDKPGEMKVKTADDAKVLRKEMVFEQLPDKRLREREPHDQRSDQAILQPLIDQILDMAIYDRVEWRPEQMGFDQGHVVRVLLLTPEKNYRIDFGSTSPDGTMIYFHLEDIPFAYLTPVGSLAALRLPEEKFLDHQLFSVPASAIQRFMIEIFDKSENTLRLECVKVEAEDEKGRPISAWKIADRPVNAVRQEDLRSLRLAMMSLRATNRQWKMQYDQLPPNLQFAVPWPNPLNLHPDTERLVFTIEHIPEADHEEGRVERYEMVRVEVPPALYQSYTGRPFEQQDPAKRSFWVARHFSGLNPLQEAAILAQQAANPTTGEEPEHADMEWISFTRAAVDPVVGMAQRIFTGTPAPGTEGNNGPNFMPQPKSTK